MEGFSFVTLVTGLNRPNTGKEDDDDEDDDDDDDDDVFQLLSGAVMGVHF
jgi:ABC-type siderophore export system fused ATPase/permease subunit